MYVYYIILEAILRDSGGVCNLSECVIRPEDTIETLKEKIEIATIIGTIQSTLTNFRYLRPVWKHNCEEERLLGVSLTGIMDHPMMCDKNFNLIDILNYLKDSAKSTNEKWANILKINKSKQIGLLKPSGTVSTLVNCSSGIHPRMFKYYIRRVRQDKKDPLSSMMIDQGVPYVEDCDKFIFSFYIKSPDNAITTDDVTAIEQLELWKKYRTYWCDGNPSQTIYYTDDEYFAIADWLWKNWNHVGGLSFFPKDDHIYENAPYEKISKEEYEEKIKTFPKIDFSKLPDFEIDDSTTVMQEFACAGGTCEMQ